MNVKTIVVGCGRLGANIARVLSQMGNDVDILDIDADAFRKLPDDFAGRSMVADATDLGILEQLELSQIGRFVITTGDDNVNIFLADMIKTFFHVNRIYVRLYDVEKGELIMDSSIQTILPFTLSLDAFLKLDEAYSK